MKYYILNFLVILIILIDTGLTILTSQTHRRLNDLLYRVYEKKLNRFEIALNFAKQLLVSNFYVYSFLIGYL